MANNSDNVISLPSGSENSVIGDIKTGIQAADHQGWLKLDGRAITLLTAAQQGKATDLGIGANLPDATNSVLMQNGSALGSVSGSNDKTIAQNQLPNVNFTGRFKVSGGSGGIDSFAGVFSKVPSGATNAYQTNGTSAGAGTAQMNLRLNGNVTQQSLDTTPQTLSVNVFIYLGS